MDKHKNLDRSFFFPLLILTQYSPIFPIYMGSVLDLVWKNSYNLNVKYKIYNERNRKTPNNNSNLMHRVQTKKI